MRIAILGAGGIGGYYGGVLARAGNAVHILARAENLTALRQKGLEVRTSRETFVVPVKAEADVKAFGAVDWVIVAVKTYSLAEIAPAVRYLAEEGALIVPLLNGVDIADHLVAHGVPKDKVLGGLTTISAVRIGPGVFERQGEIQRVVVGELDHNPGAQARSERVQEIADAFREAGVEAHVSSDIRTDLWRKLAFLAPLAAACGLARSPIGPIRATPLGRLLLERGIREVVAVGQARGIPLGEDEIARIMKSWDALPGTNKPSLLRDLEAGRPTEIDDLSGAVSRLGRMAGIETPIHDTAAAAITAASTVSRIQTTSLAH